MAVYDKDGSQVIGVYSKDGTALTQAYDVSGNPIMSIMSPFTVMTFNVGRFRGINSQSAMQTAIYTEYTPDIIGMQELGTMTELPAAGAAYNGYTIKQFSDHNNKLLMLKSDGALLNYSTADFTHQDPLDAAYYQETRAYQRADIVANGKTITWFNSHLCFQTPSVQYQQMGELFEMAQACDYSIITADFNANIQNELSDDYVNMFKQFVDAGYNLANNSPTAGFTKTWTGATTATSLADFTETCDSIIVSGNITIDDVVFDTTKLDYLNGSDIDHIPIIAYLTLN